MEISYHGDTDSMYIHLSDRPSVDSEEISPNFVVDFDEQGRVMGIDIDLVSRMVPDLKVRTNLAVES